jgi:predicted Zn-dependent peptidase
MVDAFITQQSWENYIGELDRMKSVTKEELIAFANKYLTNDYVIVFKREGEDKKVMKVDKPSITPVQVNRTEESGFKKDIDKMTSPRITPAFLDYKTVIQKTKLASGIPFDYIQNTTNQTFSLYYVLDMGKNNDKKLPIAIKMLPYLGTDKYSAEELNKEFFKLGVSFDVFSSDDRVYVSLSGLEESLAKGVELFEHILANVKPDKEVLENIKGDIAKERTDNKKNKSIILRQAMANYAKFGKKSSFSDVLSNDEIQKLSVEDLVQRIKDLTSYKHSIFYYGALPAEEASKIIDKYHKVPKTLKTYPAAQAYKELNAPAEDKVYFVNYPMVQAEIMMVAKGTDHFDLNEQIMSTLYNDYFGSGLSSIVFQEIRESKALAYSAYAAAQAPRYADKSHFFVAYVGTQSDKMKDAIPAMREIVENMPIAPTQIANAKEALLKKIETERITQENIYWNWKNLEQLKLDRDTRKDMYEKVKGMTDVAAELKKYQETVIKNKKYTILVLADKNKVDMKYLESLGKVQELSLEEVFGY